MAMPAFPAEVRIDDCDGRDERSDGRLIRKACQAGG
jgi:hypothetical protein